MDSYGITNKGPIKIQKLSTKPAHTGSDDKGRMIYCEDTSKIYCGDATDWQLMGIIEQSHINYASVSHTITDPADAPADADALRDDLVANTIPSAETALDTLATKINSIIDALEANGITATS